MNAFLEFRYLGKKSAKEYVENNKYVPKCAKSVAEIKQHREQSQDA